MLVTLTEVVMPRHTTIKNEIDYNLRNIAINPSHVICVTEEPKMKMMLEEGRLPKGLDSRCSFSRVTVNRGNTGTDVVVVGSPEQVLEKLEKYEKRLLQG